jgi:hypothetical protein
MTDEPYDGVAVLDGGAGRGLRWVVSVDASDGHLLVMLNLFRGERYVSGSGFDGSRFFGGTVLQRWRGYTDDLPWFVMARTDASVTKVVATTNLGTEVELSLSRFMPEHGSRFAAAGMPEGECPCALRAERDGLVVDTGPQPSWTFAPRVGA